MITKIKLLLMALPLLGVLGLTGSAAALSSGGLPTHVTASFQGQACSGISQLGGTGCGGGADTEISHLMDTALNLLSLAAGFIAIVMIIVSGMRFITANGESSSIASARSSLIYALVGIVIAAIAQILVHFVIGKVL